MWRRLRWERPLRRLRWVLAPCWHWWDITGHFKHSCLRVTQVGLRLGPINLRESTWSTLCLLLHPILLVEIGAILSWWRILDRIIGTAIPCIVVIIKVVNRGGTLLPTLSNLLPTVPRIRAGLVTLLHICCLRRRRVGRISSSLTWRASHSLRCVWPHWQAATHGRIMRGTVAPLQWPRLTHIHLVPDGHGHASRRRSKAIIRVTPHLRSGRRSSLVWIFRIGLHGSTRRAYWSRPSISISRRAHWSPLRTWSVRSSRARSSIQIHAAHLGRELLVIYRVIPARGSREGGKWTTVAVSPSISTPWTGAVHSRSSVCCH